MRIFYDYKELIENIPKNKIIGKFGIRSGSSWFHQGHVYMAKKSKENCDFLVLHYIVNCTHLYNVWKHTPIIEDEIIQVDEISKELDGIVDAIFIDDMDHLINSEKFALLKDEMDQEETKYYMKMIPRERRWYPKTLCITTRWNIEREIPFDINIRSTKDGIDDYIFRYYNFQKGIRVLLIPPLREDGLPLGRRSEELGEPLKTELSTVYNFLLKNNGNVSDEEIYNIAPHCKLLSRKIYSNDITFPDCVIEFVFFSPNKLGHLVIPIIVKLL